SEERNEEQRMQLAAYVLSQRIADDLVRLPKPSLVYAAASDFPPDGSHKPVGSPREVRILRRGEISKPGDVALPGALSCVNSLPQEFVLDDLKVEGLR